MYAYVVREIFSRAYLNIKLAKTHITEKSKQIKIKQYVFQSEDMEKFWFTDEESKKFEK